MCTPLLCHIYPPLALGYSLVSMNWLRKNVLSYFVSVDDEQVQGNGTGGRKKSQGPVLLNLPPHVPPRPNQGLRWASERLKKDADGDEAHEFLEVEQR